MPPCPKEPDKGPILPIDKSGSKLPGRQRFTDLQETSSSLIDGGSEVRVVLYHVANEWFHETEAMTSLIMQLYQDRMRAPEACQSHSPVGNPLESCCRDSRYQWEMDSAAPWNSEILEQSCLLRTVDMPGE